jgi:hypothetical protein
MAEHGKPLECKDVGCNVPHIWYENAPDGSRLICLKAKANGKWHVKKYKLPAGVRELAPV